MSAFLLIGTIVSGIAVAAIFHLVLRFLGVTVPRWLLPTVAGATMLVMHVGFETTWFERLRAQLSDRIEVVETFTREAWWQPWSYVLPQIVRFTAIDTASAVVVGEARVQVEVWLVDRFQGSVSVVQVYDCATPRRADLGAGASAADALDWVRIEADDAVRRAACRLGP